MIYLFIFESGFYIQFVSWSLNSVRKKGRKVKECEHVVRVCVCVCVCVCVHSQRTEQACPLEGPEDGSGLPSIYLVPDCSWYITLFHNAAETSLAPKFEATRGEAGSSTGGCGWRLVTRRT